ncbi:MAG: efflux RND transporter periplasmic adaptor subunit [Deltaproteobacteria bacterium]|nr:efflux RND transporter periplasmic adaptor subunit [Deltaproteobacteria bacterium]
MPKYTLPVIAALGFIFAVYSVMVGAKPIPLSQHVAEPAHAPFKSYIAGAGIVEAMTDNISIGTSLPGIVEKVFVKRGEHVKEGEPLFRLDGREIEAELGVKRADLARAKAGVREAEAVLADAQKQFELASGVSDRRAISADDMERRRNAALIARAKVESARAQVSSAKAALTATQTNMERLTTRAPVSGDVMQINIRPGEYAQTGALPTPLMLVGNLDRMHVRVDIDENDAWRFRGGSPAVGFVRGNRDITARLDFVRVEPYVVPKKSLTGESTERVDTRVLNAIYSFDPKELPVYAGQQLDVFIEAPPVSVKGSAGLKGGS